MVGKDLPTLGGSPDLCGTLQLISFQGIKLIGQIPTPETPGQRHSGAIFFVLLFNQV